MIYLQYGFFCSYFKKNVVDKSYILLIGKEFEDIVKKKFKKFFII